MTNELEKMFRAYVECALWSSTDEDGYLSETHSSCDLAPETERRMRQDCLRFLRRASSVVPEELLSKSVPEFGHCFWLTRNRHGSGFFDSALLKEYSNLLTPMAEQEGEQDLYVGDDGKLYIYQQE